MIDKKKLKLSEAVHIIELIEQQTRAEIMSRFGRFDNLEFADYFNIKLEKEVEIREFIFGSSELVVLGERWGIIPERTPERRKRKKKVIVGVKAEQAKYTEATRRLMKIRKFLPDWDAKQIKIFAGKVKIGYFFSEADKAVIRSIYSEYKRRRKR